MRATPDFDFQLGESADMIRETVGRFADEQIVPLAERTDREDRFPRELWEPMGALGLHGITLEEEWGGKWDFEPDPLKMAEKMIAHIDKKRKALGIDKARERVLMDMEMRRDLEAT